MKILISILFAYQLFAVECLQVVFSETKLEPGADGYFITDPNLKRTDINDRPIYMSTSFETHFTYEKIKTYDYHVVSALYASRFPFFIDPSSMELQDQPFRELAVTRSYNRPNMLRAAILGAKAIITSNIKNCLSIKERMAN